MNILFNIALLFYIASFEALATTSKPRYESNFGYPTTMRSHHQYSSTSSGSSGSSSNSESSMIGDNVMHHSYHSSSSSSSSSGECLNNSLDSNCRHRTITSPNVGVSGGPRTRYQNNHYDNNNRKQEQQQQPSQLQAPNYEYFSDVIRLDKNDLDVIYGFPKAEGQDSSLRQVLLIHRHGDRTPIHFQPSDPLKSEPFWKFHGYGQITNRGKARLYLLGQMIRNRYDDFLGKSVNKNQRISRSSGALRCIESAQMFLSGFLSLEEPNSPDADYLVWDDNKSNHLANLWQPGSIQSVPKDFDGMLAESATCNALMQEYLNVIDNLPLVKDIFTKYKHEAELLDKLMGYKMDHFYKWFWSASQVEVERSYFETKMPAEILAAYGRIREAGNLAMGAYQATLKSKRLRSGLLINDMIESMKQFRVASANRAGNNDDGSVDGVKKFVHYSAHDMTLIVLLGMLDSWQKFPFAPGFASNLIMELHEDQADNEWFVKIFYMPAVPSKPIELHLEKCEQSNLKSRCTLDKLAQLVSPYAIDSWQSWMKECDNDLKLLNPYKKGT